MDAMLRVDRSAALAPHWRDELPKLLRITAPLAAGYLAEMAMNVISTVIVGHLGSDELAGVGLGASLLFGLVVISMGVLAAVGVLAAQAHGAGEPSGVSRSVRHGLWLAAALAVPITGFGLGMAPVMHLLGQDPEVVRIGGEWSRAAAWSVLPYLGFTVLRNFVSALARPRSVMVITLGAVLLDAVATYGLVYGAFGLPRLGVAGAGWAVSITCWAMLAVMALHLRHTPEFHLYRTMHVWRFEPAVLWELIRLGLPIGGVQAVEVGLFAAVTVLMGVIGAAMLAANQLAASFISIIFMVPLSISQAASMRVAHGIGAGDPTGARHSGQTAMLTGVVYMLLMALLIWAIPEAIAGLYLDAENPANRPVIELAVVLLGIAAVFQVADGLQTIAAGALRGLKDVTVPLLVAIVGYWLAGLGSGYVMAFVLGWGGPGLWWGLALGLLIAATLLTWRFFTRAGHLVRLNGVAPATA